MLHKYRYIDSINTKNKSMVTRNMVDLVTKHNNLIVLDIGTNKTVRVWSKGCCRGDTFQSSKSDIPVQKLS